MSISKKSYSQSNTWDKFYKQNGSIKDCLTSESWKKLFNERIFSDSRFGDIENKLKEIVEKNVGDNKNGTKMYPFPTKIFNAFNITSLNELKVVIIGQDPYFNCEYYDERFVPQATGLSFSVPTGFNIPSSLQNIFANQLKFKRIHYVPNYGDLTFWACQGCLMLNTSLTVLDGQKNCHGAMWKWVTDRIIKYISDECDHVVFVMWGLPAYGKINLIDIDKHDVVISSHPSGLSANKGMRQYPPFNTQDHFGIVNEKLKEREKDEILWQL